MKTFLRIGIALVIVAGVAVIALQLFTGSKSDDTAGPAPGGGLWTCSMHPQVRLPKAGKCPICSMPLIPVSGAAKKSADAPAKIKSYRSTMMPGEVSPTPRQDSMGMDMVPVDESEGSMLELSEHARAMASVETAPVERRKLTRELRAVGKVQVNESALATITARVDGYIERLFIDYTGVEVKTGDHLVEIYSPDLVVAQQELLLNSTGLLAEASKLKLRRWELTDAQIEEIVRTRKLKLASRAGDFYPVLAGLKEGDRVAVRGNFLLDSQFQISGLPSLFYEHGQAGASGHQHGGGGTSPGGAKPTGQATPKPAEHKH